MKRLIILTLSFCISEVTFSQNTFPSTGNVGIGTSSPQGLLHTLSNSRNYYVNKAIPGATEDAQGINYLLLHKAYVGTLLTDYHVMGKISAIRGSVGSYNRKWTIEVNTASAYNANMGSIMTFNEGARLVMLTYNNERFVAVEIANAALLNYFSFTGYMNNAAFQIVYDQHVSDVQPFTALNPITLQGSLGIGTNVPSEKLDIYGGSARISRSTAPFNGNFDAIKALWLQGQGINEMAIGYSSTGGGAAAIGFNRGGGYDTEIKFYTNPLSSAATHSMVERMRITQAGNVGIGTTNPGTYKLAVEGTIGARKIKVAQSTWADFVFDNDYCLPSLSELEKYIDKHRHLPGIPTAEQVEKEGVDLGEMNVKLLQKVEELTLYLIEIKKENADMKARLNALENK